MAIATPLSVSGRWITDANGNRAKLAGVGDRPGHGLFAQDWTGVSNPVLLDALRATRSPTTRPGV